VLHAVNGSDTLSGRGNPVADGLGTTMGGAIGDDGSDTNVLFAPSADDGDILQRGILGLGVRSGDGPTADSSGVPKDIPYSVV
jgi:hypothetical protein